MSAAEPIHWRDEQRALVLKAIIAEAEKALADLTKAMQPSYPLPTTVPYESPLDGAKLGHINRARSRRTTHSLRPSFKPTPTCSPPCGGCRSRSSTTPSRSPAKTVSQPPPASS